MSAKTKPTKVNAIKPIGPSKPTPGLAKASGPPAQPNLSPKKPVPPRALHDYLVEALNPDGSVLVIFSVRDVSDPEEARTRIEAVLAATYPPMPTRIGTIILDPPPRRPHIERARPPGPIVSLLAVPGPAAPASGRTLTRKGTPRNGRT